MALEVRPPCTCGGRGKCTMCSLGSFAGEQTAVALANARCQARRDRDFGGWIFCRLSFGHTGPCLYDDCGCPNECSCVRGGDQL